MSTPTGNRTPVSAVRGLRPRPLDDEGLTVSRFYHVLQTQSIKPKITIKLHKINQIYYILYLYNPLKEDEMNKLKWSLVFLVLAFLIASCGFDLDTTAYVVDILNINDTSTPMYANATIINSYIEEEEIFEFETLLTHHLSNVENVRVEEIDYTPSGVAEFSIPMFGGENFSGSPDVFSIYVKNQDGRAFIYFVINQEKYDALDAEVYETQYQNLDLSQSSIKIEVVNDSGQDVIFHTSGVFVNGSPAPFEESFTIEHRDSIELTLGDVLKESFKVHTDADPKGYTMRLITTMDLP